MSMQLKAYEGLRAQGLYAKTETSAFSSSSRCAARQVPFQVVAQKRVQKKQQVILTKDVTGLGAIGQLKSVPNGYFRNYLSPQGYAKQATEGILERIEQERLAETKAKAEVKAKAAAMARALATIGKFIIKKKVGENDQIFGSVTTQEVVDAIFQQTARRLEKKDMVLPDIKTVGTFDASIKLHPEVIGTFKVVVQKEKNS